MTSLDYEINDLNYDIAEAMYDEMLDEADYAADLEAHERRYDHMSTPLEEQPQNTLPHSTVARALIQYQNMKYRTECTFEQIEEGDIVYRTHILSDGSSVTSQGVATKYMTTEENVFYEPEAQWHSRELFLASSHDALRDDIVLERIPRSNVLYS